MTAREAFASRTAGNPPNLDRAALIKEFDRDGNGSLDDAEKTALRKHVEQLRGQGRPSARTQDFPAKSGVNREALEKFDADADGKLNPEGREAAIAAFRAKNK